MKRATMTAAILMLLISLCEASVKDFVGNLTAANPARLIPSGRVEFTTYYAGEYHGQVFAYTQRGVLSFNKDHILLETHIIEGQPVIPDNLPYAGDTSTIARDVFEAYTPTYRAVWATDSAGMVITDYYQPPVELFNSVSGGMPPRGLLSAVTESNGSIDGRTLRFSGPNGRVFEVTVDETGRLTEYRQATDRASCVLRRFGSVTAGAFTVPKEISLEYHRPGFDSVVTTQVEYIVGNPTDDELTIPLAEGVLVQDQRPAALAAERQRIEWEESHASPTWHCGFSCQQHLPASHHWCCAEYCMEDVSWVVFDHGECEIRECDTFGPCPRCESLYEENGGYNLYCITPGSNPLCPEWGCYPMSEGWVWTEEWLCRDYTWHECYPLP